MTAGFIWQVYLAARINSPGDENWWLIAICSTFCPLVSLLGAKRPQNKAWQWIVASFWIIAALPAIEGLALQPGEALTVPIVWRWFYVAVLLSWRGQLFAHSLYDCQFTVYRRANDFALVLFTARVCGCFKRSNSRHFFNLRGDLPDGIA